MQRINWQAFSTIASIVLSIVALFGEVIRRRILGPKLRLVGFDNLPIIEGVEETIEWFLLKVINKRPLVECKNCRVVMKRFLMLDDIPDVQNDFFTEECFFTYPQGENQVHFDISKNPVAFCFLTLTNRYEITPCIKGNESPRDPFQAFSETFIYTLEIRGEFYKSPEQYLKVAYNRKMMVIELLSRKQYYKLLG